MGKYCSKKRVAPVWVSGIGNQHTDIHGKWLKDGARYNLVVRILLSDWLMEITARE